MTLDYSVYFKAQLAKATVPRLRFNRTLVTFVPTGGLVAGFTELAIAVTPSNWKVQLRARGGKETDLIWIALANFFAPVFESAGATAPNPARAAQVPDRIIVARRTNAEPTKWTATVTGGLDGIYTIGAYGPNIAAEVSFEADTNTAAEIRAGLVAAWNLQTVLAAASTAANNGVAALDVTTDVDGFPFIVYVQSTGSPITLANATDAGDYEADLDAIMPEVIDATTGAKVSDLVYFIHDLQVDDQTNRQGTQWCIDQKTADGRKTYLYLEESYASGIPLANVSNDPASTLKTLLTPLADESNDRGVIHYVDRITFKTCTWLGRCSGYNLGAINWAQRELSGQTPTDLGDNEVVATIKYFNVLSPEAPHGNMKWGYLGSGRYIDDLWAEDILSYEGTAALQTLLISDDALDYTDPGGIASGAAVIENALLKYQGPDYPYLVPDSISVTSGKAADQSGADKENRVFPDYTVSADRRNLINRYGDEARPITLTISV